MVKRAPPSSAASSVPRSWRTIACRMLMPSPAPGPAPRWATKLDQRRARPGVGHAGVLEDQEIGGQLQAVGQAVVELALPIQPARLAGGLPRGALAAVGLVGSRWGHASLRLGFPPRPLDPSGALF